MKKILGAILIFLFSLFPLIAQEDEWYRDYEFEEYLFEYEVKVETWVLTLENGNLAINFEDAVSRDIEDVIFQLSYILRVYDFYLVEEGISFLDTGIDVIIYSLFNDLADA